MNTPALPANGDHLLRVPEVLKRARISRATLYRLRRTGQFPPAIQLTTRTIAWRASEIDAWLENLPAYSIATGQADPANNLRIK